MRRTLLIYFGITCLLLSSVFAQAPVPTAKISRYADAFVKKHDTNSDGILQQEEWEKLPGTPRAIDIDGDGQITRDELIRYFTDYGQGRTIHGTAVIDRSEPYRFDPGTMRVFQPFWKRADSPPVVSPTETQESPNEDMEEMMKANEQPVDEDVYQRLLEERQIPVSRPYHVVSEQLRGVPTWFLIRDRNGDGQVSLAEFAPTLALATVKIFERLDKNGNGLIEPDEVRNSTPGTTDTTTGTDTGASE